MTGAGGYLAGRLTDSLLGGDGCERLIGLDLKPLTREHPLLSGYPVDVRDAETTAIIARERPDVIVHAAYAVDFLRRTAEEQSVNLGGLERVLAGAEAAGSRQVVVMSSTVVYGAYPGIATFQDEDDPVCIHPHLPYARDKVLVEKICRDFSRRNPGTKVCIVRPAIVVGPHWRNLWAAVFFMLPVLPRIDGHDQLFQFIHEDDLIQLLRLCIDNEAAGTFNAAADGALNIREIGDMVGRRTFPVPAPVARASMRLMHRLRALPIGSPPGLIDFFTYPWVVSNKKAKEILGFTPAYTSREAFAEAVRIRADILRGMGMNTPGRYLLFTAALNLELRRLSRLS
jgi:UDP-glucose 4-epimerase